METKNYFVAVDPLPITTVGNYKIAGKIYRNNMLVGIKCSQCGNPQYLTKLHKLPDDGVCDVCKSKTAQ